MQAKVLSKVGGNAENVDVNSLDLQSPSIVHLKIAPEAVRAFERVGTDLKLVLASGKVIVIQNFFVQNAEGERSDLVLQDDAGVDWWGQYTSPWSKFHFTEIEDDAAAALPWWPVLLGLLGAGAAAAAGGGGGGGDGETVPSNRAPEIQGNIEVQQNLDSQSVVELDLSKYFSDPDGDPLRYTATGLPKGLTLDPETGIISGTIDPSASQGGDDGTYTVTITATDPSGNTTSQTVTWTVGNPPPVANDDTVTGQEDTPVTGNVLTGQGGATADTDPDGDVLTVKGFAVDTDGDGVPEEFNPGDTATIDGVGTITIGTDGGYTFTPVPDWNGTVPPIEYTISDGEGGEDSATLRIEIEPVVDAIDDAVTVEEDTPVIIDVLENDTFSGDNPVITEVDGQPIGEGETVTVEHGTVTLTPDGKLEFTPDPDWNGETSFDYTVTTDTGEKETANVTVNVTPANDDAVDDAVTTPEDTPVVLDVLDNDDFDGDNPVVTKVDGQPISAGETVTVDHGTVTLQPDGKLEFTPDPDWHGETSFEYTAKTDTGEEETATATVTVTPVNDSPVAVGPIIDQSNEDADTGVSVDVTGAFSDVDGDTLTYSASGLPPGLSINATTGEITGTINRSASQGGPDGDGQYSVTVTATDGDGASVDQTFTWTVTNPAPTANDDAATTDEDTQVSGNVLDGSGPGDVADSDPDSDPLTVTSFTVAGDPTVHPAGSSPVTIVGVGTITLGTDGSYTFTPADDWNGAVPTITYTISDGEGGTDTADLDITVNAVNDAPVVVGPIIDQSNEDADTGVSVDVTGAFSDVDGDTLTYSANGLPPGLSINATTGEITGTIDRSASQGGPDGDGQYSVTVTATDGDGASVDQTFTWTVTNPAPTANDDAATTDEDTQVSGNVLDGSGPGDVADSDPDSDPLTVTSFTVAGDPTVHTAGSSPVTIAGVGTITLGTDGSYTFTPADDWNGTVPTITYTISDGQGGTDTADLVITVTPVNDDPVIAEGDQTGGVVEAGHLDDGTVVPGTPSATGSFTATDVDSATLTWSVTGTPDTTYGTFSIDPSTGEWTYTLDNALPATQALNEGDTVDLTYTVQVSDGEGGTAERTVTITITGTNDAPVAEADTGAVTESGVTGGGNTATPGVLTANGNVLDNDTDVDAGETATLQVSEVSFGGSAGTVGSALAGTYGSLVLNDDGTYAYTLDNDSPATQALKQDETVTETFTYTVVDANGATSTSTLTVTVTGTNDQPVITSDAAAAAGEVTEQGTANPDEPNTATGTLTASDVDTDATQTWSIAAANGTYGTIAIDPGTGEWIYTLDNTRAETQALNDGDTRTETFTARVTDEFGAYSEQVITVTVNGSNDDVAGIMPNATVPLTEDGSAAGTLQDYVSDVDDVIVVTGFQVDADGDGTAESYAPGVAVNLLDSDGNARGTLTINEDGSYSFEPAPDYAGDVPTVTYTMEESSGGTGTVTQTLTFEITKVADAPDLEDNKTVSTNEDTSIALGLIVPVITDAGTGTGNGDHPERLGEITLTIGGDGADGVTLSTGGTVLTPVGGVITIVLTDVPHTTSVPAADSANGIYHLTTAEYQALVANPSAESGDNFTVTVSVTSYEVDGTGATIPGVAGATSTQVIDVDVQAVTDGATLAIDTSALTFAEDDAIDLTGHLTATLNDADGNAGNDTDGSETYWYTVTGLPDGTVVTIDGVATTINASTPTATSPVGTSATPPPITITPPPHYSGDINDVTITLHSQDVDSDSSGIPAEITSSVTLDLHVTPVAGDVTASDVTTPEDTAVAFLAGVAVTDTGTGGEVIDSVSFTVPTDWTVTAPTGMTGWSNTGSGSVYTITFDNTLTEAQREAILDAFTITPPAHSSADATITLSITTTDTNTVNGAPVSDTKTVDRDVTITVTPVAERTDADSDGATGNDVTMIGDHAYTEAGEEDEWFALGVNYTDSANSVGHDLMTGWSNEDGDEFIYAVLTPTLASDTAGADAGDTVFGTQFRYSTDGGSTWETLTYAGEAIWVPQQYLDTLQVMLPPDVSGTLTIRVQTGTVDYDDDSEVTDIPLDPPRETVPGVVSVAVSGDATLSQIEFDPVADEVTMALNGRASGLEDTDIPLAIRTTSSDASETFNVTISGIPVGATITYGTGGGALTFTATAGDTSFVIPNFSNDAPITFTPPLHSSGDFPLTVSAVSVDGADTSDPVSRTINVSVTGVADVPDVTLVPDVTTTEAALDGAGNHSVVLSNLVSGIASPDTDGSETATLRITGLSEEFSVVGATMVTSGTGAERVWVVAADKLADVSIVVPENYSGTVDFKVAGVTTENDGDSYTGALTDVSFTVTPSPEATITDSATLEEDVITLLNLAIVHQGGDVDETLGQIYIPADYAIGANYTLYLNGVALESPTSISGVTGVPDGDYYVIPADQVENLGAMGASNLDGSLGSLGFFYEVIDPSSDGTLAPVSAIKSGTLALDATPVTDTVDASITGIIMDTATGTTVDANAGDDAVPDTATVTEGGALTVHLHVNSTDTDGSEHLIRVLIEGVPDGVTVTGASQVGAGSWLLVYDGSAAQSLGTSGIDVPVEFVVGQGASNGTSNITMTVQAQDRGDSATPAPSIEEDSVSWNLNLNLADGDPYTPPVIDEWRYNGEEGTEDTAFRLADVMDARVSTSDDSQAYSYTVTITDLPPGTTVAGMTLTTIDGVPTWTATVTVPAGANSQTALDGLLAGISITPPENGNDNNADFGFDAKLTASAVGGASVEEDAVADMPVIPVTDPAAITVTTSDVDEGTESVTATIDVGTSVDGAYGQIVDGKLYVQVTTANNEGGTVTDAGGNPLALTSVSGVAGVPDGDYYVIDVDASGGSVELRYTAADGTLEPGSVTFTAYAQTQEAGAGNVASANASETADIVLANNGVTVASNPVTGSEAATSDKSNAIELSGLSVALNDADSSESIRSILLSGVPVGFLLYVGDSAGNATLADQASNAGGDGTTNTWVLSANGTMPAYVAILPAANWSGTLSDLALVVESGESSLPPLVETFPLDPVTVEAVANGVSIDPTLSFGREGQIIALNLNAAMADPRSAIAAVPDGSTETTTLQITGLGQHAAFYVGDTLVTSGVSYDQASDTYTLTGLSQTDLDGLGFVQAASAMTDKDDTTAGTQITVTAWTVESANGAESARDTDTVTLNVSNQLATAGDDTLIWTGADINGRDGDDTVVLRYGENLTGEELAGHLTNIETLDLGVAGGNAITGLTPEQVAAMTDSRNGLTISGSGDDSVSLSGDWNAAGSGIYTAQVGSQTVTLTVEGVAVTQPDSGFSAFSAPFTLPQGDGDDLGDMVAPSMTAFMFEQPDASSSFEGLLADTEGQGETAADWLPEETDAETAAVSGPADGPGDGWTAEPYAYVHDPLSQDELEQGLHDAHVLA